MDDSNEFDIYEDLDVFESGGKQQEKSADYLEIREQLMEAKETIRKLHEENARLKEQIVNHQRAEGTLERNSSSLLITAKAELKRKEQEIHDLRKEKDNIVFRRTGRLQKNVQTYNAGTQSQITCKPFVTYEFKRVDDTSTDKSIERNQRRDEINPFAKSKENNNENKINHKNRECFDEKNGNNRHQPPPQARHQDEYNLRGKRSRDDERRDQINVERSKRRRSRSASKDRKRARRSRSRSRSREQQQQQQRRRDRNNHDRNSPEKSSRNQRNKIDNKESQSPKRRGHSPKRPSIKLELDEKLNAKRKPDEIISKRHSSKGKSEPDKKSKEKEKDMEICNQSAVPDEYSKVDIKRENNENNTDEKLTPTNTVDAHGCDALEEGEIDDHHDEMNHNEEKNKNVAKSPILTNAQDTKPKIENDKPEVKDVKPDIKVNSPRKTPKNENLCVKNDEIYKIPLPLKVDDQPMEVPETQSSLINIFGNKSQDIEPKLKDDKQKIEDIKLKVNSPSKTQKIEQLCVNNDGINKALLPSPVDKQLNEVPETKLWLSNTTDNNSQDIKLNMENDKPKIEDINLDMEINLPSKMQKKENICANNDEINNASTPINDRSMEVPETQLKLLNTSGSKSVKNISTSSKDYLIVEDENDETTIYITRKKKVKKKGKKKEKQKEKEKEKSLENV